jgi:glycosyltransferase involved in cell wall biosynthesis
VPAAQGARISNDARVTSPVPSRLQGSPRCLVTVIASVYEGGRFIETFMQNVCSQSIFRDWCELIVIDAASPEGEGEVIRRWMADFPNIRYFRTPQRIGIYEAWNLCIRDARGEFLTNANVDDLRRHDSLEIQAATLEAMPAVDVVYQDVHYALEPCHSFERVAAFNFRSYLPQVTPAVMLSFNPPHNAPMWRRSLHDQLGPFDTRYRSAGDYEFWLRCAVAGKVLHRVADPHVVYYQNPKGVSTRAETTGHSETSEITALYSRLLLGLKGPGASGTLAASTFGPFVEATV